MFKRLFDSNSEIPSFFIWGFAARLASKSRYGHFCTHPCPPKADQKTGIRQKTPKSNHLLKSFESDVFLDPPFRIPLWGTVNLGCSYFRFRGLDSDLLKKKKRKKNMCRVCLLLRTYLQGLLCVYIYIYIHIHTYHAIYIERERDTYNVYVYAYITYIYIYIYTHTYIYMCAYIHIYLQIKDCAEVLG